MLHIKRMFLGWVVLAVAMSCQGAETKVIFKSGEKGIPAGPVVVKLADKLEPGSAYVLKSGENSDPIPAQVDRQGHVWWWSEAVEPNTTKEMTLTTGRYIKLRVQPKKVSDEQIDVMIDNELFTTINAKKNEPKVYLYPVIGPTCKPVTRHYPMKNVPGERQDHHHHRSLWTAHGDIRVGDFDKNKSNYWHEPKTGGNWPIELRPIEEIDHQALKKVTHMTGGNVFGVIEMEIDWIAAGGRKDFTEVRTYRIFAGGEGHRIIDQKNVFKFTEGDTMFANTKEGGICALRIATSMDEKEHDGKGGDGRMTNANGQVGHGDVWGKAAAWCDYVGPVDGQTIGIAVFDAPTNFRHPTRWHIRDYGLYTANPFGAGNFTNGKEDGTAVFKKGKSVTFDYRILIHKGDTKAANVADQYALYSRLF